MTQGIPCGFKIQWQSIHQEPQSISRCFHWGWVSSIDWISLPELSKAFIYDDIVYDGLFICYAKKKQLRIKLSYWPNGYLEFWTSYFTPTHTPKLYGEGKLPTLALKSPDLLSPISPSQDYHFLLAQYFWSITVVLWEILFSSVKLQRSLKSAQPPSHLLENHLRLIHV